MSVYNIEIGQKVWLVFGPSTKGGYTVVSGEVSLSKKGQITVQPGGFIMADLENSKIQKIPFCKLFASHDEARAFTSAKKQGRLAEEKAEKIREHGIFLAENGGKITELRVPRLKKDREAGKIEAKWAHTVIQDHTRYGNIGNHYFSESKQSYQKVSKWVVLSIGELPNDMQDQAVNILEDLKI